MVKSDEKNVLIFNDEELKKLRDNITCDDYLISLKESEKLFEENVMRPLNASDSKSK